MTEDEFRTLNELWKKLRAKSRDRSVTPAERAAFARKANEIKAHVHAQLGDTFDVTAWVATDPHPEPEEATMLAWIGQPAALEPFVFTMLLGAAGTALFCFIVAFEKLVKDLWALF